MKLFRFCEDLYFGCEKGYKYVKVSIFFFLFVKIGCIDVLLLCLIVFDWISF